MKPRLERTNDVEFLRGVFTHPRIWPWICEDGVTPESFQPLIHPLVVHLRYGNDGVFTFRSLNRILYECHVAMFPGTASDEAATQAIAWMWANTQAKKLVCNIPAISRHAIAYAHRAGFVREGRMKDAFMRNGKLHDLIVMGVSKCQKPQ